MRIAFLSTSMGMGGADQQILRVSERLNRRGHGVLIISLTPLGSMGLQALDLGIQVVSLNMPKGIPDPRALVRLIQILHNWRPHVLHSHLIHANVLASLTRPWVRIPVRVATLHSSHVGGAMQKLACRFTNASSDLMTIVSNAAAEKYIKSNLISKDKLRVIPNGLDVAAYRPAVSTRQAMRSGWSVGEEFVWLAVGRFQPAKDYPNMLNAFAHACAQAPGTRLLIAGEGPLEAEARSIARRLGVHAQVQFLGVRSDVPQLMQVADGYVMSSAWEGLPMVLLEAAAAELPIVATDVGGNREVVVDGRSGMLVSPNNSEALSESMLRLMRMSPEDRKTMGREGRRWVEERHDLDAIVSQWEALFRELLAEKGISV